MRAFGAAAGIALPLTLLSLWSLASARARGAELFDGSAPLSGRLSGHDELLPAEAVRCSNCHELETAKRTRRSALSSTPVENVGPLLGPSSLTRAAKRRGGPPSLYTEQTFCRLLREGVDPAQIVIPQLMPRYELGEKDCEALWNHLVLR